MSEPDRRLWVVPASVALVAALSWAGSRGGVAVGGVPVFALCAGAALAMQWVAFVPAWLGRTERFYDLVGSVTYVTVVWLAFGLSAPSGSGGGREPRSLLLALMITVWAARLGFFLFRRIHDRGSDRRFDRIKTSFSGFLMAWTLQGVWVCFTAGAALAAITSAHTGTPAPSAGPGLLERLGSVEGPGPVEGFGAVAGLGAVEALGFALWLAGFLIEVAADEQKRRFRSDPANEGRFVATGLWAWSRHPNYFGEIVLWLGIALVAAPGMRGWQHVTLVSPLFVALLLTKGSGIPILEDQAEARWGGEASYERYKATTPLLVPRPPV